MLDFTIPTVAEYRTVCPIEELPPGSGRLFRYGGKDIALFNIDGVIRAMEDTCLHAGGPLHEGTILDGMIICPWHHWEFDPRDGSCALNPYHKLAVYETRVQDGQVQINLR